jgi:hypothetical protein
MVYDHASSLLASATDPADIVKYAEWERRGKMISNMSVVAIMLGAPISSLVIRKLGSRWVRMDAGLGVQLTSDGGSFDGGAASHGGDSPQEGGKRAEDTRPPLAPPRDAAAVRRAMGAATDLDDVSLRQLK